MSPPQFTPEPAPSSGLPGGPEQPVPESRPPGDGLAAAAAAASEALARRDDAADDAAHEEPVPLPPLHMPDIREAATLTKLLRDAALANNTCPYRRGSCVHLPMRGRLVISGDLHDHRINLQKLIKLARLQESPDHHLILHEVIHGPYRINGRDLSIRTLARIAALKIEFPEQVHILQSNHELAQLGGEGIMKDGKSVVAMFDAGVDFLYPDDVDAVRGALNDYIRSLAVAVRCANGIFCSHSLPNQHKMDNFDLDILERKPTDEDLTYGGTVYRMVWGRRHSQELADMLAAHWKVKVFVTGHQPADMGYDVHGQSILILASDHEHGHALPIKLDSRYDMTSLLEQLVPLSSVVL